MEHDPTNPASLLNLARCYQGLGLGPQAQGIIARHKDLTSEGIGGILKSGSRPPLTQDDDVEEF